MEKIRMFVKDLKNSCIKHFYDVILMEKDGTRALNISIGDKEAEYIALFIDKIPSPRPLTYDVFVQILNEFSLQFREVVINRFFDGNFYALAIVECGKQEKKFDIRPSDAINLALRTDCPIYITQEIMDIAGFDYSSFFKDLFVTQAEQTQEDIDNISIFGINMLQDLLKDAIEKEDYITASILRDKIKDMINNQGTE